MDPRPAALRHGRYSRGFASWVALAVVFLTSIEWLRRKKYQVFYTLHFAFLLFYLFAGLHTPHFKFYGLCAMAIYGFDKLQRIARGCASYAERRPRAQASVSRPRAPGSRSRRLSSPPQKASCRRRWPPPLPTRGR